MSAFGIQGSGLRAGCESAIPGPDEESAQPALTGDRGSELGKSRSDFATRFQSVTIAETLALLRRGFVVRRINRVWRVLAASGAYALIGAYRTERRAFIAAMGCAL